MHRKLRLALAAAIILFGGMMTRYAQSPAFAYDTSCSVLGTEGYCGLNTECLRYYTDPSGLTWCEEYKYTPLYLTRPAPTCVCNLGACQCIYDPV
jgi:hypothetical protein